MIFTASKFNPPKGSEDLFGENPYSVLINYKTEIEKNEFIAIEWKINKINENSPMEEIESGFNIITGSPEFSLEEILDLGEFFSNSKLCFRYRVFTAESTSGPQDSFITFASKVPAKQGKIEVSLNEHLNAEVSLESGGYGRFKCKIRSDATGDWCGVAMITDQSGQTASSAELACDGEVDLNVGMAGKPKSLNGTVGTLGANEWIEVLAEI